MNLLYNSVKKKISLKLELCKLLQFSTSLGICKQIHRQKKVNIFTKSFYYMCVCVCVCVCVRYIQRFMRFFKYEPFDISFHMLAKYNFLV